VNYYYLGASLPALALESEPRLSYERYRALCAEHFSAGDLKGLQELESLPAPNSRHAFARAWDQRETALRNAIARHRAHHLQVSASEHVRPGNDRAEAERAVVNAYGRPTPLERELTLDRFRWSQAEELAGLDPFSGSALLAYGLKLRLAERWASLREDSGEQRAEEIVAQPPREHDSSGEHG
jgi:hypothetical protein